MKNKICFIGNKNQINSNIVISLNKSFETNIPLYIIDNHVFLIRFNQIMKNESTR